MDIKRTGPGLPGLHTTDETSKTSKRSDKNFDVPKATTERLAGAEKLQLADLTRVQTLFRRNDLSNPAKVDTIVKESIGEIIDKEYAGVTFRSDGDRNHLIDWMANDPLFRGRVLSHLEKVLK